MTDPEIQAYLADNGYPDHIVRGGREGLIRRWSNFVSEVERGYEFGLEDYRNDLDIRGIIRLIGADSDVADADQRLQSVLTARDRRVWESTDSDAWWDFGYPANARGDLKEDLKSAGLWE